MAIQEKKDARSFLWHPEEHMAIKEKMRMLRFQQRSYAIALKKEQKTYDNLLAKQEDRKKSYKPMFETIQELDAEYDKGEMDNKEYMSQRSKIWQVYSDRGHIANIAWLTEELDKVNQKIEAVENLKSEFKEAKKKYRPNPKLVRARKTAYERKRRRKKRQKEREERWHRYGIG